MNIGFRHHQVNKTEYLTIPAFDDTGLVRHCFTTRLGGVSTGEWTSLNLGLNKGDFRDNVIENYKRICGLIHVDYKKIVFSRQIHGDEIGIISHEKMAGELSFDKALKGLDALMTDRPGIPLVTFHADCVPLFFLDPVKKAVAVAHSGWRGTVKKIGKKVIEKMVDIYGCNAGDILAAIGPSIGKCHFEVDEPVADEFLKAYGDSAYSFIQGCGTKKFYIDLWEACLIQFRESGINDNNITLANECTVCHKDKYFSHRGDAGKTGSLAAMIQLK